PGSPAKGSGRNFRTSSLKASFSSCARGLPRTARSAARTGPQAGHGARGRKAALKVYRKSSHRLSYGMLRLTVAHIVGILLVRHVPRPERIAMERHDSA